MAEKLPLDPLAQQCMTFCAIVKALEGSINTENVLPTLDKIWHWTHATLSSFVWEHIAPEVPHPPVDVDPPTDGLLRSEFTVKDIVMVTKGEGSRGPWTLWKITDTEGGEYTTFNRNRFEIGKRYATTFREVPRGNFVQKRIEDAFELQEG